MMYKVLIVDDEKLMQEALRVMVSKVEGFEVAGCVSSGEEAVEVCSREKIHVVFMDIMMPGIPGIDASKEIYAKDPSVTIYIISAYSNFEFAREALSAKVRDYISKPVSFSIIAKLLENYQQSQQIEQTHLGLLLGALKKYKYNIIIPQIPGIVQKVFEQEARNKSSIYNRFMQIGQGVVRALDPVNEQTVNLEEQFPINDLFGRERYSWTFWLLDVIDYAFRRVATTKCEHLQKVFAFIDDNVGENINLSQVSEKCSISQSYLSRLFKQYLGVSVMEYIHLRKLRQAKMYFAFTDMGMADIAYRLGYNESSYFSKVFKKYEGITPQQYKNSIN